MKQKSIYRDGLELTIDGGIKVTTTRAGHLVESFNMNGVTKFFVTLKDSHYCAHGSSVAEAITDAEWKDPKQRPSREALISEIQHDGKERKITLTEFRLLTGACKGGCTLAIARAKVSGGPMTAFEIRDKISPEWGNKLLSLLAWTK